MPMRGRLQKQWCIMVITVRLGSGQLSLAPLFTDCEGSIEHWWPFHAPLRVINPNLLRCKRMWTRDRKNAWSNKQSNQKCSIHDDDIVHKRLFRDLSSVSYGSKFKSKSNICLHNMFWHLLSKASTYVDNVCVGEHVYIPSVCTCVHLHVRPCYRSQL